MCKVELIRYFKITKIDKESIFKKIQWLVKSGSDTIMVSEKYPWGHRPRYGLSGPATDPDGPATDPNGSRRPNTASTAPMVPDGSRPGILILTIFYSNICNFYKKIFILH